MPGETMYIKIYINNYLFKLNKNAQLNEESKFKNTRSKRRELKKLSEFPRGNMKLDASITKKMKLKRKVLVLDMDETLIHSRYNGNCSGYKRKYKTTQSENPPDFVSFVSLIFLVTNNTLN